MTHTFPPAGPERHGINELLTLVSVIRRLAFGTPCRRSGHRAASATPSAITTTARRDPAASGRL